VVRSFSPAFTWGGGQVLHVHPPRHRRRQAEVLARLEILEKGVPEEVLPLYLEEAGAAGLGRSELEALLPWDPGDLLALLLRLSKQGQALNYDPEKEKYILAATASKLKGEITGTLAAYHRNNPLKPGLSKEELRRHLPPQMEVRLFNQLLNDLAQQGQIAVEKELVRLAGHRVTLAGDQEEHVNRLAALYRRGGLSPPTLKEAAASQEVSPDKLKQLLTLLLNQGHLVKVKEDLYFHREAIDQIKGQLVDFLKKNREITVLQFKDLTQTSRKFTIPLLEYFDSARTTVRVGETRRLRQGV